MFLQKIKNPNGRIRLGIKRSYRDKNGKPKQHLVLNCGYLDELEKKYDDPISYFKKIAKEMTEEYNKEHRPKKVEINFEELLEKTSPTKSSRKNLGYASISKIYHDLEIDYFINNHRRYTDEKFNHNAIFKLLVFDRILFPSSKKSAYENKSLFFDNMDFSVNDIYKSLSFFNKYSKELLMAINKRIKLKYKQSTSLVYYNVASYYFETNPKDLDEDLNINSEKIISKGVKKKEVSKEHKTESIVQIGLFVDEKGIPITYNMNLGNSNDCKTQIPPLKDIRDNYNIKNIIVVAEEEMMTEDNLSQIITQNNGYIIRYSIKNDKESFQSYLLNQENYINEYDTKGDLIFKYKSRIVPRKIIIQPSEDEKPIKLQIKERQIIFYSKKYADKAKYDRQKALEKSFKIINNANIKKKPATRGVAKYVKQLFEDKNGKTLNNSENPLDFNSEILKTEEKYDGYYAINTNVIGLSEEEKKFKGKSRIIKDGLFQLNKKVSTREIIDIYRGLWKNEEPFKVTKSILKTKTIYPLWETEHIEAHFLICFTSLVILRLLEYKLKGKYSTAKISESLSLANGSYLADGFYHFNYYDDVLEDIGKRLNIDYSRKYLKLDEIRKMMGEVKKNNS